MANEDKKDFNAMLHDNKDMPKFQIITDEKSIEKYGGNRMYFAPPIAYDEVMKKNSIWQSDYSWKDKRIFCEREWCRFYGTYNCRNFCIYCCMGKPSEIGR